MSGYGGGGFSFSDTFNGFVTAPDGSVYSSETHSLTSGGLSGSNTVLTLISGPVASGGSPASVATSTGVNPTETSYSLYGHTIPLSVFGVGRIGGEIIAGPWVSGGLASFCISFGVPADPAGTRDIREIAFDSEVVWSTSGASGVTTLAGGTFTVEAFTARFYQGTLAQSADALETSHFGANAVAYRPQILLWFENLPLAGTKFGKIPYVSAVIGDGTGNDVNLGEAFERLAYSPFCGLTSAQFETSGVTDGLVSGGIIIASQAEFLATIQQFSRFYNNWDILQTDKLRIVDRGSTVTADISLDATRLTGDISVIRQGADLIKKDLGLSTIDPDADYTIVESVAQRPRDPVAVTSSVGKDTAYLPVIMDASTRSAIVTFAKYHEEATRKSISGTAMAYGLQMEPGAFVAIQDLGDDFTDEIFKVVETLHGVNNTVEFSATSIFSCNRTEGPCVNSGHAAAFLARTSGLDITHTNAYTALLNGLDADAISCKLDFLHIYATQDSTTALLNLIADKYNGTAHGGPTFTADRGFTGVEGSTTVYIDTGFNPVSAVDPVFTSESCHVSAWSVLNDGTSTGVMIGQQGTGSDGTNINPKYTNGNAFFRSNTFGALQVANANTQGHFLGNRTGNLDAAGYRNGTSIVSSSASFASPVVNLSISVLAENDNGTIDGGTKRQVAMASIGAGLTATDITNFYSRLRTFMTAVGVP